MGKPQVMRKRVHAIRRGPDGSAFQKCDQCGVSVAIALLDMHEYECRGKRKRWKSSDKELDCHDQPRSPFCFFMESYIRDHEPKGWIKMAGRAFEIWICMTLEEKQPFVTQAQRINSAYLETLLEEVRAISVEEDEADSAMVGKFDPDYESSWEDDESFESFDTFGMRVGLRRA